jgi:DNA helicase IV
MTQQHPEFDEEKAFIEFAYQCLEESRADALKMRDLTSTGPGGTFQARFERNAVDEQLVHRLEKLELGDSALVFGRIDRHTDAVDVFETFHIGRLALSDKNREPVVVDWRAPVAEPFYRATGREPMGLARRRHFIVNGRELLGLEDELFGEGHLGVGGEEGLDDGANPRAGIRGYSTLLSALERGRTGQLGDIVATIQSEQDEIIRSPHAGVLVVQGGPGTGKTVVALHRAAYLLYTFRFPLEDQGVLVIGPNRVFLRYIERVLPSLGEAGVEQVVLADLVPDCRFGGTDTADAVRVKGMKKMAKVIDKAVSDRQRPLKEDVVFPFRTGYVRLDAEETKYIVKNARRRYHRHNQARRYVENEVWAAIAATWKGGEIEPEEVREALRSHPDYRAAIERMWPVLTPAQLLHDLFGSRALVKLAAQGILREEDYAALFRPRSESVDDVRWSNADAALLDEARFLLGPRLNKAGKTDENDEIRTYGHIVVDEVQDLTPMQLRMVTRRSLNGSMTIVGDIAQATGPHAPAKWADVLDHLPGRKEPRVTGLSVGYRIPAGIMALADRVMHVATPGLRSPRSVREGTEAPVITRVDVADVVRETVARAVAQSASPAAGRLAVVCPDDMVDAVAAEFDARGTAYGRAQASGLDNDITIVPATLVKGLEIDQVIVVEPARIVELDPQGLRLLYVALTRSTRALTVVHGLDLPPAMA